MSQATSSAVVSPEAISASLASRSTASRAADLAIPRWPLYLAMAMLFTSALPDAMVVPLLNELFVQRYGVSAAAAHWFMSVNLVGAVLAIPVLGWMRRTLSPATILLLAAMANTALLAAMYLPIGFVPTMGVRFLEGAADLVVFAVLFDLLSKAGPGATRGRRLGLAGTVLMFGLFAGAIIGGRAGLTNPVAVFLIGAKACLIVAIAALLASRAFNSLVKSCPVVSDAGTILHDRPRPLWPPLSMAFTDRAIAGLMTATLPLYFATVAGQSTVSRGWLIGLPILLMAVGSWPAGLLGDRVGHLKLRTIAALLYAGAIAVVPFVSEFNIAAMLTAMAIVGLAGAALLPSCLALVTGTGRGSIAMGAYRASGDVGYLLGIALAGTLLALFGGASPDKSTFTAVILTFAGIHLAVTLLATRPAQRSAA